MMLLLVPLLTLVASGPDDDRARALINQSDTHFMSAEFERALATLNRAELTTNDAGVLTEVATRRAIILDASGRRDAAARSTTP